MSDDEKRPLDIFAGLSEGIRRGDSDGSDHLAELKAAHSKATEVLRALQASAPRRRGFTIERRGRVWTARYALPGRPRVPLGVVGEVTLARATDKAQALLELGEREGNLEVLVAREREKAGLKGRKKAPASGVTVAELAERWWTGRLFAQYGEINGLKIKKSADSDKWRFTHVRDVAVRGERTFGSLLVSEVEEEDVDRVFPTLPRDWSSNTRTKVYALLHKLFDLAISPCRLRRDNPVGRHLQPAKGTELLHQELSNAEFLRVLRCPDVPLAHRALLAFAIHTGLAKGVLKSLRWDQIDFEREAVLVVRSRGGCAHEFLFEVPGFGWLLDGWRGTSKPGNATELVFAGVNWGTAARWLRSAVKVAGISRFQGTADGVKKLDFGDTRKMFARRAAAEGKSETWMRNRAGYKRSERLQRVNGGPDRFADLTEAIPELIEAAHLERARRARERGSR